MTSVVVVSFDPGVATGWAIHRVPAVELIELGLVGCMRWVRGKAGQFREGSTSANVDRALDYARLAYENLAGAGDVFAVVTEGFTLRMMSMDPELLEPVRFNAVLDDRLRGTGVWAEVQSSSDAMTAVTDARLSLWGQLLVANGGMVHGRDAQRHGLLWLRRFSSDKRLRLRYRWSDELCRVVE